MKERLEFSEFTFGYALTENFSRRLGIKGVPVFPSLIEEGTQKGGYDVAIDVDQGLPILLQFKVPQVVTRKSKHMPSAFPLPYYRAHLRCRLNEDGYSQHSVLLQHENDGRVVYYATPKFHRMGQLEDIFTQGRVVDESAFFTPSDVGPVTDEEHHVAYHAESGEGWLRSEPVQMPQALDSGAFLARLTAQMKPQETFSFADVLESMVVSAEKRRGTGLAQRERRRRTPGDHAAEQALYRGRQEPRAFAAQLGERRSPRDAAAVFANFVLGTQLVIVKRSHAADQ